MTDTRRWDAGYGNGRSSTALTTLKIAVLAPIPSASVTTTVAVNPTVLPQDTERIDDVLTQRIEDRQSAAVAVAFRGLCDATEGDQRGPARLGRCHAGADVVVDVQLNMAGQLGVEFAVVARLREDIRDSQHRTLGWLACEAYSSRKAAIGLTRAARRAGM